MEFSQPAVVDLLALLFPLLGGVMFAKGDISFDQNYYITWGNDHVISLNQGTEIQLTMDNSSGCGFGSKLHYGSGFFHVRLKVPGRDSAGVVTAFYLTSQSDRHDELDFEFLGNREGQPISIQTNVFINGVGGREQRIQLWFDPSADFHTYKLLWNSHQIVFYVDDVPIRVFKNYEGIYPAQPMQVQASLWNGESWATDGGQTKVSWTYAPFKATFQGFDTSGCPSLGSNVGQDCYSSKYWWNSGKYWQLGSYEQRRYEYVRKHYMNYDYCSDRPRYPTPPPECLYNS